MQTSDPGSLGHKSRSLRAAIGGTIAGQVVEWYDYLLYAYVATEIAKTYFPTHSQEASLLAALAAFGLAFVVRPIGGVFFGHLSDRIGRTRILAIIVILMSVATTLFGVIPSFDSIGVWAPILVVAIRLVQGFSAGGETSSVMVLVTEYAPARRRCFYLAFLTIGVAISAMLAAGITGLVSAVAGADAYEAWAWRIPFWLAVPLGLVGLFLRLRLAETPVFDEIKEKGEVLKLPVLTALRRYKTRIPRLIIFFGANAVVSYYLLGFLPSYLVTTGGLTKTQASVVSVVGWLAVGLAALAFGYLTDVYGRRFIRRVSLGLILIVSVPAIALASVGNFGLAVVALLLLALAYGASQIATYTANTELFDADVRASAGGLSYNIAYVAFGGTAPIVGTYLGQLAGPYAAGGYPVLIAAIAFIAISGMPETKPTPSLDESLHLPDGGNKVPYSTTPPRS